MARNEILHVEQMARGFYSMPMDAYEKNALRLLFDRWCIISCKNGIPSINLMKLDERKAAKDWAYSGFTSDQSYLTWSVSFVEFFQLIEKKAFQV